MARRLVAVVAVVVVLAVAKVVIQNRNPLQVVLRVMLVHLKLKSESFVVLCSCIVVYCEV